jgi:hypothetical protein
MNMGAIYDFWLGVNMTDESRYQTRHRRDGLCHDCKRKALPGHSRCQKHFDSQKKLELKYSAAMKRSVDTTN